MAGFERVAPTDLYRTALAQRAGARPAAALALLLQMDLDHASYPACARLVIALSAELRTINQRCEDFLAPYLARTLTASEDLDALFLLGQLYEVLQYTSHAQELFVRVAKLDPYHPVHAHMRRSAPQQLAERTLEAQVSGKELRALRKLVREAKPLVTNPLQPGMMIAERYRVLRLLGHGSSASVYAAIDDTNRRTVALKLFQLSAHDPHQERRFRREVEVARKLSHPNIVQVLDAGSHRGRWYLTMELIEGPDLSMLLERRATDTVKSRQLLLQILRGLGHAHERGVVHRDLKPENMLLDAHGTLKLTDFGIAKALDASAITATGSMGGTPHYVSPEQITDLRSADQRSDLYSLGVIAYELFTGQCPFDAGTVTELLLMHLNLEPQPMRALRTDLPEALDRLVLKLLSKRREDRYQSCSEVASALEALTLA